MKYKLERLLLILFFIFILICGYIILSKTNNSNKLKDAKQKTTVENVVEDE